VILTRPASFRASAAYLQWDDAAAKAAGMTSVRARSRFFLLSQEQADHAGPVPTPDTFTSLVKDWGHHQLLPLEQLPAANRGFLAHDRLLLRVDITIASIERAA
jgi:hypothetical protein